MECKSFESFRRGRARSLSVFWDPSRMHQLPRPAVRQSAHRHRRNSSWVLQPPSPQTAHKHAADEGSRSVLVDLILAARPASFEPNRRDSMDNQRDLTRTTRSSVQHSRGIDGAPEPPPRLDSISSNTTNDADGATVDRRKPGPLPCPNRPYNRDLAQHANSVLLPVCSVAFLRLTPLFSGQTDACGGPCLACDL